MSDIRATDCGCGTNAASPLDHIYRQLYNADAPLAMGYVPVQHWEEPYPPCRGLKTGTIFPSLYKPFCGKGGRCK